MFLDLLFIIQYKVVLREMISHPTDASPSSPLPLRNPRNPRDMSSSHCRSHSSSQPFTPLGPKCPLPVGLIMLPLHLASRKQQTTGGYLTFWTGLRFRTRHARPNPLFTDLPCHLAGHLSSPCRRCATAHLLPRQQEACAWRTSRSHCSMIGSHGTCSPT